MRSHIPWMVCAVLIGALAGPAISSARAGQDPLLGAISGSVVDGETQIPIAGALVSVSTHGVQGRSCLTDDRGRFVLTGLSPDVYNIEAKHLGYLDARFGDERPDLSSLWWQSGSRRVVIASDTWFRTANIRMWRPGSISGIVTDDLNEPVVGRYLRVLSAEPVNGRPRFSVVSTAMTDDRDHYSAGGLPMGRYLVTVLPVDTLLPYPDVHRSWAYPATYYPSARHIAEATPVSVEYGRDVTDVHVRLQAVRAHRVSGTVSGSGNTWTGLRVSLVPMGEPDIGTTSRAALAVVRADGSFSFSDVPEGTYTLIAPASFTNGGAVQSRERPSISVPPDAGAAVAKRPSYWTRYPITVGDGDLSGILVALRPTAALSGRVVIETSLQKQGNERPHVVRALSVDPYWLDAESVWAWGPEWPPRSQIDGDGRFQIDGLSGGRYFLGTENSSWIKSVAFGGRDYTREAFDLSEVDAVADITITVAMPASLKGVATDEHGERVADATIVYFPADETAWQRESVSRGDMGFVAVKTDGSFESYPVIPGGRYYVIGLVGVSSEDLRNRGFTDAGFAIPLPHVVDWKSTEDFFRNVAPSATLVDIAWGDTKTLSVRITDQRSRHP